MKKTKMNLEALAVSSFTTSEERDIVVKGGIPASFIAGRDSGCQACNEWTYWC